MALSLVAHFRDQAGLIEAMVDLAVEEFHHYREIIRMLQATSVALLPDQKDPDLNKLNQCLGQGSQHLLCDRLLLAAIIERRVAERFGLIADGLNASQSDAFYRAILNSEARHWCLFMKLAGKAYCATPADEVALVARLNK